LFDAKACWKACAESSDHMYLRGKLFLVVSVLANDSIKLADICHSIGQWQSDRVGKKLLTLKYSMLSRTFSDTIA
jgi:hypothetical protein